MAFLLRARLTFAGFCLMGGLSAYFRNVVSRDVPPHHFR